MLKYLRTREMAWMALAFFTIPAMTACSSSTKSQSENSANANQIIGAGSSFIFPAMTQWVSAFQASHPGVNINYQSIGSGGGIRQLKEGLLDFAASDAALDDQQLKDMPALVQIPESAGPVCITYNLPALKAPLRLSSATLSDIYLGKIKNWHDAAIRKDNPGVALPDVAIAVVHRSDGSGTTNIFTTYLTAVNPTWEKQVGKGINVNWPVGLGGKGNEGVTGLVKQTPGGIGYVELAYAEENKLPVAEMRNQAGKYVEPSVASTSAAIDAFSAELDKDVRTPIVNPPATAKDAYPIAGLTFLLVPKQGKSPARSEMVKEFVQYVIMQGQSEAGKLYYAELPAALEKHDEGVLAQVAGTNNKVSAGLIHTSSHDQRYPRS